MKLTISALCIVALACMSPALSQTNQASWEVSVSGAFSSYSNETETTNQFALLLRPGFFVVDGLEIEPEVLWGGASGKPPSFSFSGNVSYNYLIPGTRWAPFALAGYGVGNGIPHLERMNSRDSEAFDIAVLNVGGGVKLFATKAVAIRAEYRFQQFRYDVTNGSKTTKYTDNYSNAFLGVSVFLP